MLPQKYLLVVGGPTASGKTALAIQLAQRYRTVILSADSRQFFREMSIGTAKPSPTERAAAPHYFIDSHSIEAPYSVGDYEREALAQLRDCFTRHDIVVLVGGSGLYLQAVCEGFDDFPAVDPQHREVLQQLWQTEGLSALQDELATADPEYFATVDRHNPQRLIRALEVYRSTGKPFSHYRQRSKRPSFFQAIYLFPHWPREVLYRRINQRVEQMMAAGLVDEARRLYPYRHHHALQTVGYRELFAHFDGEYDLPTAVALIQRNTRRFAKRQLTWNRRLGYGKHFTEALLPWLPTYLSYAMHYGQQLYWERGAKVGHSQLSWRGTPSAVPHLTTVAQRQDLLVRAGRPSERAPDAPLQYLLIHELHCRFPDRRLVFDLPSDWEASTRYFRDGTAPPGSAPT